MPDRTRLILQSQFPNGLDLRSVESGEILIVAAEKLLDVCEVLKNDPNLQFEMLNNVSAVDFLETDPKKLAKAGFEPHLEVVYHVSRIQVPMKRFPFKVLLPRWKNDEPGLCPELPSVSHIWRTADWHEREIHDLFGIRFTNHPDLRRILLSDDWVGYPLRKDYEFPLEYHDIRCR